MGAVPKAVPSAVAPSVSGNNVTVDTRPQAGPYQPMTGNPVIPQVPRTEDTGDIRPQPHWVSPHGSATVPGANNTGAPSVPGPERSGGFFPAPPIDSHYTDETQVTDPYRRVNSPPTRGMFTWVKAFANHIALGPQVVDANGFRVEPPQQRTSWMRMATPPHGGGYAPEAYVPRQLPQHANTAKFLPALGTVPYGTTQPNGGTGSAKGPLNRDTYGAGQVAGGIGGSWYTPAPGPPPTTSTAGAAPDTTGMPTWG